MNDEQWRMREHLHRCPECLKHKNCGGARNKPCGRPYLVACADKNECAIRTRKLKGKSIRFAELEDAQRLHKALTQSCANSGERCCAWTLTELDNPWYQTACGRETDRFDGGYCTYCGGVITINGRRTGAVAATGASETDRRESEK